MLDENKIRKLRELALRGVGGEMENAKRILERNGISLDHPEATIGEKFKRIFSKEKSEFYLEIDYTSDTQLINVLCRIVCKNDFNLSLSTRVGSIMIRIKCYPEEYRLIKKSYYALRKEFDQIMNNVAVQALK